MSLLDQLNRRQAIRIGMGGVLGLSLGDLLRADADARETPQARSVIHLYLTGGFSVQESWDPKPEAPTDYRGSFDVVRTNRGDHFSENFPRMAAVADKMTVIRSMHCKIPDHGQAAYHLFTGYLPTTVMDFPQMGAVVSQQFGSRKNMPPYVAIPNKVSGTGGTGHLSSKYGAFELNADPGGRGEFKVKDFSLPGGVSQRQFERRRRARAILESRLRSQGVDDTQLGTMNEFYQRAYTLLNSPAAKSAFSLETEPQNIRDLYGHGYILNYRRQPAAIGGRLMMARRLVEAGVRFVTVRYDGWDSHVNIRNAFTDKAPALDHAIAGLLTDLDQRGMLDDTLVMVTTEFGRTPRVNSSNGRDHWARSYSMLLAGGGVTRGQIYGASDATASEPAKNPVALEDFLYTVYHQLGVDANNELLAFGTRPIEIVKGGKLVKGLLA
jgi:hypothetical protein